MTVRSALVLRVTVEKPQQEGPGQPRHRASWQDRRQLRSPELLPDLPRSQGGQTRQGQKGTGCTLWVLVGIAALLPGDDSYRESTCTPAGWHSLVIAQLHG